jgi:hypothetical protein
MTVKLLIIVVLALLIIAAYISFIFLQNRKVEDALDLPTSIKLEYLGTTIPYGISGEDSPRTPWIGLWYRTLAGVLLQKPEYDANGFVNFKIGIPIDGKLIPLNILEQPYNINNQETLSITFISDEPGVSPSVSRLTSVDETLEKFGTVVGKQIAFEFIISNSPEVVENYIRQNEKLMSSPKCDQLCRSRYERIIAFLPQSFVVFEKLGSNEVEFKEMSFAPLITKIYIQL